MRHLSRAAAFFVTVAVAAGFAQTTAPDPNAPINESAYPATAKIKVACVGDSITFGYGLTAPKGDANTYPAQLQRMLGGATSRYDVHNFGVNSLTLLLKGDKPYQKDKQFAASKDFKPDVVVIMLGTNDTKAVNWVLKDQFVADYKDMVGQYQKLESHPRIFLCYPTAVIGDGSWGINDPDVLLEMPMIDTVAKDLSTGIIDMHAATKGKDAMFNKDHVHPNNDGAEVLAKTVYKKLTGKEYAGPSTVLKDAASAPAAGR